MTEHVVVIGTSWGGLSALTCLLRGLPRDFPAPIIIVQHRGKGAGPLLAELLQDITPLVVREVEDKDEIRSGHAYVAPSDYHLLVHDDHFSLSTEDAVKFSRPSIDVTFLSAAHSYGARAIGVVLTGANDDGARGLRGIADHGGRCIIEDPDTAESRIMPAAALRAVPTAERITLGAIVSRLMELVAAPSSGTATDARPAASR